VCTNLGPVSGTWIPVSAKMTFPKAVAPAKAGAQESEVCITPGPGLLDSRLRGNDTLHGAGLLANNDLGLARKRGTREGGVHDDPQR